MIRVLLWKDMRLIRMIALLAILSVPLVLLLGGIVCFIVQDESIGGQTTVAKLAATFGGGTAYLQAIGYFTVTVCAGCILAGERQDRTCEFLACLPPLRWHHLVSKWLVVVGFILLWLLIYGALFLTTVQLEQSFGTKRFSEQLMPIGGMAQLLIGCSGIAWAASAIARSSVIPILVGFITPGFVVPLIGMLFQFFEISVDLPNQTPLMLAAVCLLGVAGFVAGAFFYLIRSEE